MKGTKQNNPHFLNSIIHNRIILYVIVFASLINMTAYGLLGDIITPLIFILVGTITAYYNKNMIVILVVALAFSNVLKYGSKITMNMEGFTEGLPEDKDKDESKDGNKDESKDKGKDKGKTTDSLTNDDKKEDSKPSEKSKTDVDTPTMTSEEEEKSLKEFTEMKNKVVEIVDAVERNMEKLNKKMNDIHDKVTMKEKNAYGSTNKQSSEESTAPFSNPFKK